MGEICNYDWYALELKGPTTATVTWDNGMNCLQMDAQIQGNEIHLGVRGVDTVFMLHDVRTATGTFRQGEQTWVKQLEKTRDDPNVLCD